MHNRNFMKTITHCYKPVIIKYLLRTIVPHHSWSWVGYMTKLASVTAAHHSWSWVGYMTKLASVTAAHHSWSWVGCMTKLASVTAAHHSWSWVGYMTNLQVWQQHKKLLGETVLLIGNTVVYFLLPSVCPSTTSAASIVTWPVSCWSWLVSWRLRFVSCPVLERACLAAVSARL